MYGYVYEFIYVQSSMVKHDLTSKGHIPIAVSY